MGGLSKLALKNHMVVLAVVFMVLFTGPLSFQSHPSREDPKILIRTAVISAQFPGMSPERIENLITTKVEEKIREIPEIEHIRSTSRNGSATIFVDVYERFSNLAPIWQNLRNKMNDIKASLPQGTAGPFVNDEYGNVAMATIALTAEGFSRAEMRLNARFIRDRLYSVPGTRKIELFGIEDERIFVEVSNIRLAQYGLSPDVIVNALAKQNIISPGGAVQAETTSFVVEPTGNYEQIADIGETTITIPNQPGQTAYLKDLATISRAYTDPLENPAYFNGQTTIVLSVAMMDSYDASRFALDLKAKVSELEAQLPIGYQLNYITFQPDDIATSIDGVMENLYQTLVVVLIVVMLFLGWRTGLIVGAMVPLTMLLSILVMRWIGVDLERMSLATLIIALGLLVDNGTVISEEIQRRLSLGEKRVDAAIATGKDLALPLLTSSLTTILAFMPLMLAQSSAGEYTRSISLVIAIALLGSWLIAMTLTPLLCVWFVKPGKQVKEADAYDSKFYHLYKKALSTILNHKAAFLGSVFALLVIAIIGMQSVPKVFFPASERPQLQVLIDYEAGTNTYATSAGVKQLADWLNDREANPYVTNTVGYVAGGGPRFYLSLNPIDPDPHRAFMLVNLQSSEHVQDMAAQIRAYTAQQMPEARVMVKPMSLGPDEANLVELRVYHNDPAILLSAASQLKNAIQESPYAINVKDDWENRTIKLVVDIDQVRAGQVGLTSEDVSDALNSILSGRQITEFREDDTIIPVTIRALGDERLKLDRLSSLNLISSNGVAVPLLQIADVKGIAEYPLMQRRNMERLLTVSGKNLIMNAGELKATLDDTILRLEKELGVRIELGGELEASSDAQAALSANMPLAIGIIILLLVSQFNSFAKPLIILSVIPLTLIGVTIGLLIAPGANFGFMAILGLLSLAGIIINNAIVLIDRINIEIEAGLDQWNAIINASMTRLRPILVTTATTVLGFMPIILSKNILFYDLGIVVVGGLIIGTLLTLGVVPVLYAVFYRVKKPATT